MRIQRLAHIGGQKLFKFLLDLLPESQNSVTLGLLGAKTSTVFENINFRSSLLLQLVRLGLSAGYDGVRLVVGLGKDGGGLLVGAVDAVLFDGRNKILNLKFHSDHLLN